MPESRPPIELHGISFAGLQKLIDERRLPPVEPAEPLREREVVTTEPDPAWVQEILERLRSLRTAVALVGILAFALNASGLQINAWSNQLEMVSYALIALVGAWLLATQLAAIFRRWQRSRAAEAHVNHAGHDHARDRDTCAGRRHVDVQHVEPRRGHSAANGGGAAVAAIGPRRGEGVERVVRTDHVDAVGEP